MMIRGTAGNERAAGRTAGWEKRPATIRKEHREREKGENRAQGRERQRVRSKRKAHT